MISHQKDYEDRRATKACLKIANHYLHGEADAFSTAQELAKIGPFGQLLAGEVMLDLGAKNASGNSRSWLVQANKHYRAAAHPVHVREHDPYQNASTQTRGSMRLAQLQTYESIYRNERLPRQQTVEEMYLQLGRCAASAVELSRINPVDKSKPAIELRGTIGELAVLLLAQRTAIREIGCNTWLPVQSLLSQDHGGDCLENTDAPAWDISILTHLPDNNQLDTTYRLQVKTRHSEYTTSADSPSVTDVYIHPDLSAYPGEMHISKRIIESCVFEMQQPEHSARVSKELDRRTDQLLDIMG